MTQLSHADGILPYEVRIPVHPTGCLCPQSPDCRGKAVGPQVPAHHPRRNLPAVSMEALLREVEYLIQQGPQGPPSQERQAQIDRAQAEGHAPAMKMGDVLRVKLPALLAKAGAALRGEAGLLVGTDWARRSTA